MSSVARRSRLLTSHRLLLALAVVLGLLAGRTDYGTSAAFVGTVAFPGNRFDAGVVDLGGLVAGSTGSDLPTAAAFSWTSSGAGVGCANLLPGLDVGGQRMAPGEYCVAKVTIRNNHSRALSAWMRIRLVRVTPAGHPATDAMNDRLRFYMSEYTDGTAKTAAEKQAEDCNAAYFKPVPVAPLTATSRAEIADVQDPTSGSRTALTMLTTFGKNLGVHPGASSPPNAAVQALAGTGLGLAAGTGGVPTEANMKTDRADPATYTAFNLVGNDEVTNPKLISNSNTDNGTRPGGTIPEARLEPGVSRHYCVAMYFPSDTDITVPNGVGDNQSAGGNLTYHLVVSAAQTANRSVN